MIAVSEQPEENTQPPRPRPMFTGQQRMYAFSPQPDINAAEAVEVMEMFHMGMAVSLQRAPPEMLDMLAGSLMPETKRHFKIQEKPKIVVPR